MPYEAAMQYLCGHLKLREMPQILQEVEWVRHFYGMLQKACLFFIRLSLPDSWQLNAFYFLFGTITLSQDPDH